MMCSLLAAWDRSTALSPDLQKANGPSSACHMCQVHYKGYWANASPTTAARPTAQGVI